MSKKRRTFSAEFKARVALEALKEQEPINAIASRYDVLPVQVSQWKAQALENMAGSFESPRRKASRETDWKKREAHLFRKIGQLEVERDWLYRGAKRRHSEAPNENLRSSASSPQEKRAMIDAGHRKVPLARQCRLLGLARSTAYHRPRTGPDKDADLRNRIDELYTKWPFFGSRQMRDMLRREGWRIGRKRVRRLMRMMGLEAQCPKPNLSRPAKGHKVYPYLMKTLPVDRPNRAWCADITYIRMEEGFMYLMAVMDWYSRKVLSWSLSNTLDTDFCLRALEAAVETHGVPEVFNTDQGCQFTSSEWTAALKRHGIRISMDGRGRALDNAFVERLWRSLKYEEVYRREYTGVADLRQSLGIYFEFYNHQRPHSSLDGRTPAEVHLGRGRKEAA